MNSSKAVHPGANQSVPMTGPRGSLAAADVSTRQEDDSDRIKADEMRVLQEETGKWSRVWSLLERLSLRPEPALSKSQAAKAHISQTSASLLPSHMAFEYLQHMRSPQALGKNIIDCHGNFADPKSGASDGEVSEDSCKAVPTRSANKAWEMTEYMGPGWEQEFQEQLAEAVHLSTWFSYIGLSALLTNVAQLCAPVGSLPEDCPTDSLNNKGFVSRLVLLSPGIFNATVMMLFRTGIDRVPSDKLWRWYPRLSMLFVVMLYSATQYVGFVRGMVVALGGEGVVMLGRCPRLAHIKVSTNFSSGFPTRKCLDQDLHRSIMDPPFPLFTVGCESAVVDATIPRQIEVLFVFVSMGCSWRTALQGTMTCNMLTVICQVATGSTGRHMWYRTLMLLMAGSMSPYLCYLSTQEARTEFRRVKQFKLAARQSRNLLSTLIPPNVLDRLASHSHDMGILATDIAQTTVMFCSLFSEEASGSWPNMRRRSISHHVSEFQRLHHVYLDFDEAVRGSRLYKYQHVGPWYIITCPNAAAPFPSAQSEPCPPGAEGGQSYATDMARLAQQLVSVARSHRYSLKVGIHHGSAAGAVLGKIRAFYCVYGETVNMASRLCRAASPGHILVSTGFIECLQAERQACVLGRAAAFGLQHGDGAGEEAADTGEGNRHSARPRSVTPNGERDRDAAGGNATMRSCVSVEASEEPLIVYTSRGQMAFKGFAGTQETFHVRADGGRVVEETACEDVAGSDDARSKVFNVDAYSWRRNLGGGSWMAPRNLYRRKSGGCESLDEHSHVTGQEPVRANSNARKDKPASTARQSDSQDRQPEGARGMHDRVSWCAAKGCSSLNIVSAAEDMLNTAADTLDREHLLDTARKLNIDVSDVSEDAELGQTEHDDKCHYLLTYQDPFHRAPRLLIGLALHMMGVIFQYVFVALDPEWGAPGDLSRVGPGQTLAAEASRFFCVSAGPGQTLAAAHAQVHHALSLRVAVRWIAIVATANTLSVYVCAYQRTHESDTCSVPPPSPLSLALLLSLSHSLSQVQRMLHGTLMVHGTLSFGLVCLALHGRKNNRNDWLQPAGYILGIVRVSWLGISLYIATIWPVRTYTLVFPMLYSISQFMVVSMQFGVHTVLYCVVNLLVLASCYILRAHLSVAFVIRIITTSLAIRMLNVWAHDVRLRQALLNRIYR